MTNERLAAAAEALARHEQTRDGGDQLAARRAHETFHFQLYEGCGSDWLVRSIRPVWRNAERYRVESMRYPEHVRRRAGEHHQMLDAVRRGDADTAATLIRTHLASSAQLVAETLDPAAGPLQLPGPQEAATVTPPA